MSAVIALLLVLIAAGAMLTLGWLIWGRPLAAARQRADDLGERLASTAADLAVARATADERQRANTDAMEERERSHNARLQAMRDEFERLAGEALERAQQRFAQQAGETLKLHRAEAAKGLDHSREALEKLVNPMNETLARYGEQLQLLEAKREQAYGSLNQQLLAVASGQQAVRDEAGKLVAALRSSARASGAWGEAQLRNVLEMAGLREGIDFTLQTSTTSSDGSRRRPDAILRLPGGRELIVDSKCSLADYLAASETETESERQAALARHALAVRNHARGLSEKAYWQEFAASADFVIMFLPGENFLSAALEQDLDLLRWALDQRILLAGPTNLLAIARIVSLVWRQETMAEKARQIGTLGAELYDRLAVMAEHAARLGQSLGKAGSAYNAFVGSLEARVLSKAREFTSMGIEKGRRDIPELPPLDATLRQPRAISPSATGETDTPVE